MLTSWAESLASMQGHSEGSYVATEASVRGEYGEDGWMLYGGKAPLSRCFPDGVVLLLTSSAGSSSLGWMNSFVCWVIS